MNTPQLLFREAPYGGVFDKDGRYNCAKCGRKWHLGRAYSSLYYVRKHYEKNHPIPFKKHTLEVT